MVFLGADHRGFELKEKIKSWLLNWGYEHEDCGAFELNRNDDYPDFAKIVASKVAELPDSRGILICGSGIGVAIVANKQRGIRAGTASSVEQVRASVNDEDLNVLGVSADYIEENKIQEIIKTFLGTKYSNEERHARRISKINAMEH